MRLLCNSLKMKIPLKLIVSLCVLILVINSCKDEDPKPFKQNVSLEIEHTWNDSILSFDSTYVWEHDFKKDTISPTTLIYHINHLTLFTTDSLKITSNQTYYMVDFGSKAVLPENISFRTPTEGIKNYIFAMEFTIGVADSLTNAAGLLNSQFVAPMYWGLISGYINFKFEAKTPKSTLLYHIGGYKLPYYNARKIKIVFNKPYYLSEQNTLTISSDILKLFNAVNVIDPEKISEIQEPNKDSQRMADNFSGIFSFKSFHKS